MIEGGALRGELERCTDSIAIPEETKSAEITRLTRLFELTFALCYGVQCRLDGLHAIPCKPEGGASRCMLLALWAPEAARKRTQ